MSGSHMRLLDGPEGRAEEMAKHHHPEGSRP